MAKHQKYHQRQTKKDVRSSHRHHEPDRSATESSASSDTKMSNDEILLDLKDNSVKPRGKCKLDRIAVLASSSYL
jgi:hypothetical protein